MITMIVALKEQSRIFLAADSLFRDGNERYYNHQKIVQCEPNQVLMAGCGNYKIVQEFIHGFQFNATHPDIETCSIYLNNLHKTFQSNYQNYYQFLIVGDGRIMHINSEGLVVRLPRVSSYR